MILGKDWKIEHELWFKYELQLKQKDEEISSLRMKVSDLEN